MAIDDRSIEGRGQAVNRKLGVVPVAESIEFILRKTEGVQFLLRRAALNSGLSQTTASVQVVLLGRNPVLP